jgi:aminoglycoside phosphotransferase (APT) family kinase protein
MSAALRAFLDGHGIGSGEVTLTPIGDGHSNLTFSIRRSDGTTAVLRRPPEGPLPPSAHDVLREARLLRALDGEAVALPRVLAMCEDPSVIGAPFYVMEMVEGEVLTDSIPAALDAPRERRMIGEALVDALVEIHAVDWRRPGLDNLGRPSGYLERQIDRFGKLWKLNRTRDLPVVERVAEWLIERLPESPQATIVHGDYRLGNVMLGPGPPPRIAAVLDWEMATIGDPLADLGYLTAMWTEPPGAELKIELSPVTARPGFLSRAELIARYEERSGREARAIRWYQALALWKVTIFMEGNYRRALDGASADPFLLSFGDGVVELAERAAQLSGQGG